MSVKLLTEHHLEFLSLKGDCTGSSESTLVKLPHCSKSHVRAHLIFTVHAFRTPYMCALYEFVDMQAVSLHMGLNVTKPVFGISNKVRLKSVSSATETSYNIEISPVASLHMILSIKRITKALIRLCGCAGWSAAVLFENPRRQVFLH